MKRRNFKKENAITLIALVITIIVMLILVGVPISMAVNGGLFGYAKNAVDETQVQIDHEKELSNVEPGLDYNGLIDKYTDD